MQHYSLLKRFKLSSIRLRRGHASTNDETQIKLAGLIRTLLLAEKAAEASSVPFLKGAIGLAIAVAESVRVRDADLCRGDIN
jgi:hypothetical protein